MPSPRGAARDAIPLPVRFAVVGVNHNHIYAQTDLLLRAGAELVSFFAEEGELAAAYGRRYPQARLARSRREILEDERLHLVVSAAIPSERGPLGVEAMRHGKDYMSDKPAFTALDQLAEARRVQAETGRIYSVCFSERFENAATVRAGELVKAGAIGKVVQTVGLGPHRINAPTRPGWFFKRAQSGGILADIASHQMDQFLFMTGSTEAEVVAAQVANWSFPQWPELEDFGDVLLRGNGGSGYARVDWYTPDGLGTWGDGRLVVLGTEGYLELRKYVDIAGRPGASHLFLVDAKAARHVDASAGDLPYGRQLLADIVDRTETAMPQAHCFLACRLALEAQAKAVRLNERGDAGARARAPLAPPPGLSAPLSDGRGAEGRRRRLRDRPPAPRRLPEPPGAVRGGGGLRRRRGEGPRGRGGVRNRAGADRRRRRSAGKTTRRRRPLHAAVSPRAADAPGPGSRQARDLREAALRLAGGRRPGGGRREAVGPPRDARSSSTASATASRSSGFSSSGGSPAART